MHGGRTNESHENIFAPGEAEGNGVDARVPFVTQMTSFVTDWGPLSTVLLKAGPK
jgi:hypothetical protein